MPDNYLNWINQYRDQPSITDYGQQATGAGAILQPFNPPIPTIIGDGNTSGGGNAGGGGSTGGGGNRNPYTALSIEPMGMQTLDARGFDDSMLAKAAAPDYSPSKGVGWLARQGMNISDWWGGLGGKGGGLGEKLAKGLGSPQAMAGMASGLGGVLQGLIGRGKRRDAQIAAQGEYDKMRGQYLDLDTSNLAANSENRYMNMENAYEDLTVNRQQAEFERNMFRQQQASTMAGLQGAAGSSGIAGLAQAMSNQAMVQSQKAAGSIGLQESRNQMYKAQEASKIQFAQRGDDVRVEQAIQAGAETGRSLDWQKTGTLFGMAQQDLAGANQAIANADAALWGGVGQLGGTLLTAGISGGA